MIYVIGGTLQQAGEYLRRKRLGPADAITLDTPERLRNLQAPHVVLVGTYIARPDFPDFEAALRACGALVRYGS